MQTERPELGRVQCPQLMFVSKTFEFWSEMLPVSARLLSLNHPPGAIGFWAKA